MVRFGYALSSEEHRPGNLVRFAEQAEQAGFDFAVISDHFHPWIDNQGQSPFVWAVLGGISQVTSRLTIGTGVTCPLVRTHPAIIAQAAATIADMLPGRFFLGVGTGENLNEHIVGERWPSANERRSMLKEAVEVIRRLWTGKTVSFEGGHFSLVDARIYTVPEELPPIYVAASGTRAAELAARIGDGLISTAPNKELLDTFLNQAGAGKPRIGQIAVCWNGDEAEAIRVAKHYWPTAGLPGELTQELPLPRHFEQASSAVTDDQLKKEIICGNDVNRHIEEIRKYVEAGFDHVYVHQVGPAQQPFFDAYAGEILPELRRMRLAA